MRHVVFMVALAGIAGCYGSRHGGADSTDDMAETSEEVGDTADISEDDAVDSTDTVVDVPVEPEPFCGDGILDPGEECDEGEANNDVAPDACRTDCTRLDYCPNDPPDPPDWFGAPCAIDMDCWAMAATCMAEEVEVLDGEVYVAWPGGSCLWMGGDSSDGCEIGSAGTCPGGAVCKYVGRENSGTRGGEYSACLDTCAQASDDGEPWASNCDCRDGYTCQPDPGSASDNVSVWIGYWAWMDFTTVASLGALEGGVCRPGCSNDRECCEIWRDMDGDRRRDPGEVTLLPPSACTDTCNECTFACDREGCPDGECSVGDPCEHASDCPPHGSCLDEYHYGVPMGVCTQPECDLAGRQCPAGSGCGGVGGLAFEAVGCVVPCDPGYGPGDLGNECRDLGVAGTGDAGDAACYPVPPGFWRDGTTGDGFCWPGNLPGGGTALGGPCAEDSDCLSTFGLGLCWSSYIHYGYESPAACSLHCNEGLALGGICGGPDAGGVAMGACVTGDTLDGLRRRDRAEASSALRATSGLCLEACEAPGASPLAASTGCIQDAMACIPLDSFGSNVFVTAGSVWPSGLCFTACRNDYWCEVFWPGGGTCNLGSGICE